jgi:hypothetical protein
MKTKTKNPINFMRRWGITLAIVLIVAIVTFSQWGGNSIGTTVNNVSMKMIANDISSEVVLNDEQKAKNYVSHVEQLVVLFEEAYQSARISDILTKMDHLTDMNSAYETFRGLKYSADDSLVVELKRLVDSWMEKRMTYIGDKLVRELAYQNEREGRAYSTRAVLALLEAQGNETYIALLDQMIKVKSYYSM